MGAILEELSRLLRRQVEEHGIVVWYDPEKYYDEFLDSLDLAGAAVLRYEGSFYALRERAAEQLRGDEMPKLVAYVPLAPEETHQALAELEVLGVVVRPGKQPATQNTKLAVIARRVLKGRISEARLANLEREIAKGQLDLVALENLAETALPTTLPTALTVLFATSNPDEVAVKFLGSSGYDRALKEKNAVPDLAKALSGYLAIQAEPDSALEEIRRVCGRQVLVAELMEVLGEDLPASLKTLTAPSDAGARRRAAKIARQWRNRRDLAEAYAETAREVEPSLHFDSLEIGDKALARVETFRAADEMLLRRAAARLADGEDEEWIEVVKRRCAGFWAAHDPEFQAQWNLVLRAAELLREAARVEAELAEELSCGELATRYALGAQPLCELDRIHREMERSAAGLEVQLHMPDEIEKLLAKARRRYSEASGLLAERFTRSLATAGFRAPGLYRQSEVFEVFVAPRLAEGRTAYVLVDGLRFEMARELCRLLERDFDVEIQPVLATMPGVTAVGMAALLPHAGGGLTVAASGKGIEVRIGEATLRNRADRIAFLKERAGAPVTVLELEAPGKFRRRPRDAGQERSLVVVTSREIDQSGEEGLTGAAELMDAVLAQLGVALRRLAEHGVEQFVIAADHGYLYFGEELPEPMKIDAPGGTAALLHRRVWVGRGGTKSESYLHTELSRMGVKSDLEIAVPWNLACFRAGGSAEYFHGGLSPQEALVPVITLRSRRAGAAQRAKRFRWELRLGREKITSRFFSVQIGGERLQGELLEAEWPAVRIEVRTEKNEVCARPTSGSYGFSESTRIISLRGREDAPDVLEPNSIAMMLTERAPRRGKVSVRLIDAASGAELSRLEGVEVSLTI